MGQGSHPGALGEECEAVRLVGMSHIPGPAAPHPSRGPRTRAKAPGLAPPTVATSLQLPMAFSAFLAVCGEKECAGLPPWVNRDQLFQGA